MTAPLMAQRAYGAAARPLRTARGTEDELFAEVAALVDAVHRSRRLWARLATEVTPLPDINRTVMAGLRPAASEAAA